MFLFHFELVYYLNFTILFCMFCIRLSGRRGRRSPNFVCCKIKSYFISYYFWGLKSMRHKMTTHHAEVVAGASHCTVDWGTRDWDPPELTEGRRQVSDILGQWLSPLPTVTQDEDPALQEDALLQDNQDPPIEDDLLEEA